MAAISWIIIHSIQARKAVWYTFRFNESQNHDFICHAKQFAKYTIDSAEEEAFSIFEWASERSRPQEVFSQISHIKFCRIYSADQRLDGLLMLLLCCRWWEVTDTNARVQRCLLEQRVAVESIRASRKRSVRQVICVKRILATSKPATCVSVSQYSVYTLYWMNEWCRFRVHKRICILHRFKWSFIMSRHSNLQQINRAGIAKRAMHWNIGHLKGKVMISRYSSVCIMTLYCIGYLELVPCFLLWICQMLIFLLCPSPDRGALWNGPRCLSVCLSVPCLNITRERKGLGSPKLRRWKPITRVSREPI